MVDNAGRITVLTDGAGYTSRLVAGSDYFYAELVDKDSGLDEVGVGCHNSSQDIQSFHVAADNLLAENKGQIILGSNDNTIVIRSKDFPVQQWADQFAQGRFFVEAAEIAHGERVGFNPGPKTEVFFIALELIDVVAL